MNKQSFGKLCIALGVLFLALELYCLPLIKAAYAATHNGFYGNPFHYLFELPGLLALLLTAAVIVYGIYAVVEYKDKQE